MERFIARQNIAHFKELLAKEADPAERECLSALLAEAEQQLADIERKSRKSTSEESPASRSPDAPAKQAE